MIRSMFGVPTVENDHYRRRYRRRYYGGRRWRRGYYRRRYRDYDYGYYDGCYDDYYC